MDGFNIEHMRKKKAKYPKGGDAHKISGGPFLQMENVKTNLRRRRKESDQISLG